MGDIADSGKLKSICERGNDDGRKVIWEVVKSENAEPGQKIKEMKEVTGDRMLEVGRKGRKERKKVEI